MKHTLVEVPLSKAWNVLDPRGPETFILSAEREQEIERALESLVEQEAIVIRLSYGVDGPEQAPLSVIAGYLNCSPAGIERIREEACAIFATTSEPRCHDAGTSVSFTSTITAARESPPGLISGRPFL